MFSVLMYFHQLMVLIRFLFHIILVYDYHIMHYSINNALTHLVSWW